MSETQAVSQKDFHECIITKALAEYLNKDGKETPDPQRMEWFFSLKAKTKGDTIKLSDLCGFGWRPGEIGGGGTKAPSCGRTTQAKYRRMTSRRLSGKRHRTFAIGPKRDRQLIVEAKGTVKPLKKDAQQAKRYFTYLQKFPPRGAVVYLVPVPVPDPSAGPQSAKANNWLEWLEKIAEENGAKKNSQINWGIVTMDEIVPWVASELIRVVGNTLVQTADQLERALKL